MGCVEGIDDPHSADHPPDRRESTAATRIVKGVVLAIYEQLGITRAGTALGERDGAAGVARDERIVGYGQLRPYGVERGLAAQAELDQSGVDAKETASRVEVVAGEMVDAVDAS